MPGGGLWQKGNVIAGRGNPISCENKSTYHMQVRQMEGMVTIEPSTEGPELKPISTGASLV